MSFAFPPRLSPGDVLFVVAPSSALSREELWSGLAWLGCRYRLRMSSGALDRQGYLAGSDARRRDELQRAFADVEAKAIVAARGGYGTTRIADDLPWNDFARRPKWIVGFSDITALHAMAWRAGVASVHGPNVTGLGRVASAAVRAAWIASIERPASARIWEGLRVLRPGRAEGPLVGGNLALLHTMAAAGRLSLPTGAVLALEDVSEPAYRVDRMLTSLVVGGHLRPVSAIVLGGFERCESQPEAPPIDRIVEEQTRSLGVPLLAGAPFGHGVHNEAFVLGTHARVGDGRVLLGGSAG